MNLRKLLSILGLIREQDIFYIGGSDVLPPPLKGAQEQAALEAERESQTPPEETPSEEELPQEDLWTEEDFWIADDFWPGEDGWNGDDLWKDPDDLFTPNWP